MTDFHGTDEDLDALRRRAYSREVSEAPLVTITDPVTGERVRVPEPVAKLRLAEARVAADKAGAGAGSGTNARTNPATREPEAVGARAAGVAQSADREPDAASGVSQESNGFDTAVPGRSPSRLERAFARLGISRRKAAVWSVALVFALTGGYFGTLLAPPPELPANASALAVFEREPTERDAAPGLPQGVFDYSTRLLGERNGWALYALEGKDSDGRRVICLLAAGIDFSDQSCIGRNVFAERSVELKSEIDDGAVLTGIEARWNPDGTLYFGTSIAPHEAEYPTVQAG